jgi:hypothetical protein
MALVAAVALVFALLPAPVSVVFSIVLVILGVGTDVLASITSASRLGLAIWIFSLYPVLPLASLYATWLTAWAVLGHIPRAALDDPKFISPIVDVPYHLTFLLIHSSVAAVALSALLSGALLLRAARRLIVAAESVPDQRYWTVRFPFLILVPIFSWGLAYLLMFADPLGVMFWYMD